jgi:outer membrane protein assembly factor BamE
MPASSRKTLCALLALLALAGLSACIYRIPIQQGNVITVEMLQTLELGMDKRKVSFVLGTPLVIDAFHQDRWDYFYSYKPANSKRVQQRASLYFEDERLARIDANINSKIDFHTVTEASENVLIVPRKKKGGFFAALTPGFITREEEEAKQEKIAQSLGSGVNEVRPGSGAAVSPGAEVLDPVTPTPVVFGATLDSAAVPSEVYAPNSSGAFKVTAGAWSMQPKSASAAISAETAAQTSYLEQLFDGFGTSTTPTPVAAPAPAAEPEPPAVRSSVLTGTTRD